MQLTLNNPLIVFLGPTANGKTRLSLSVAEHFNAEIISADSRQVFRRMDIGTGKDLEEYGATPYHLINIAEPGEEYNLFRFASDFKVAFNDITRRGRLPFLVGGTGMYLDAVLQRYALTRAPIDEALRDELFSASHEVLLEKLATLAPSLHNQTDLQDKTRTIRAIEIALAEQNNAETLSWPEYSPLVIGLQYPRTTTRKRITERLNERLKAGMIEEAQSLLDSGVSHESLQHYGLEYRFLSLYLKGEIKYNDMFQKLNSAIHQFAKQQEKWFRKIESKGVRIHWLDTEFDLTSQTKSLIETHLKEPK